MSVRFFALAILMSGFFLITSASLMQFWSLGDQGMNDQIHAVLPESGVKNPVTATLLDYRGYDTLLELTVLLLAWIGSKMAPRSTALATSIDPSRPIRQAMFRLLLAPIVLVASYLLWVGANAPGGAFQAGAVAAAALVMARLADVTTPYPRQANGLAVLGLATFVGVALIHAVRYEVFLDYPRETAANWMLLIELAASLSVAVILAMLFDSVTQARQQSRSP